MVSLKMSVKEAKQESIATSPADPSELPRYPYGSKLCFDTNEVEKLGISGMPAGQVVTVTGKAFIGYVSASQEADGEKNQRMEVQLTDIEITPVKGKKSADEMAESLYGDED